MFPYNGTELGHVRMTNGKKHIEISISLFSLDLESNSSDLHKIPMRARVDSGAHANLRNFNVFFLI
jgi:hypothetical protein